jgi:hypothetical protein
VTSLTRFDLVYFDALLLCGTSNIPLGDKEELQRRDWETKGPLPSPGTFAEELQALDSASPVTVQDWILGF